jgi:hypothetical protein
MSDLFVKMSKLTSWRKKLARLISHVFTHPMGSIGMFEPPSGIGVVLKV